jgi:hypothetical protein
MIHKNNKLVFGLFFLTVISCGQKNTREILPDSNKRNNSNMMILPESLEERRSEFIENVNCAKENIRKFSKRNGWEALSTDTYFDSVMIFDVKKEFDVTFLTLIGKDPGMTVPENYCAALEERTLICMNPEYCEQVLPDASGEHFYDKMMTHEIAHKLQISILKGDEGAIGPVWFYEGFAMYAAKQFEYSEIELSKEEMVEIITNPKQGNYEKYAFILRYLVEIVPLKDLVEKAGNKDFNEEMIDSLMLSDVRITG